MYDRSLLSRVDGAPANLSPAAHRAVPAVISEHPFGTSPVHMATSASGFREFVAQHLTAGDVVIVLFFSRHCPHCIRFKVTYRRLADRLGQRVKTEKNGAFFAAVDAGAAQVTDQEDSIWDILREFRVSFIPDVRLLVPLHRVRSAADEDGAELKNESPGTAKELGPDYGSLAAWTLQVSHHEMSEDGIDTLLRTYIETTGLDKLEENDEQFSEKRRSREKRTAAKGSSDSEPDWLSNGGRRRLQAPTGRHRRRNRTEGRTLVHVGDERERQNVECM